MILSIDVKVILFCLTESVQIFAAICNFQEMSPFCLLYPELYIVLVWIVENIRELNSSSPL